MNDQQGFWYIDTDEQHDSRNAVPGYGWYVGVTLAMIFAGVCAMFVVGLLACHVCA